MSDHYGALMRHVTCPACGWMTLRAWTEPEAYGYCQDATCLGRLQITWKGPTMAIGRPRKYVTPEQQRAAATARQLALRKTRRKPAADPRGSATVPPVVAARVRWAGPLPGVLALSMVYGLRRRIA